MSQAEEIDGLRTDVQGLAAALAGLSETLNRQVDEKVEQRVGEVAVPRKELRTRLRRNFWAILAVVVLVVVWTAVLALAVGRASDASHRANRLAQQVAAQCIDFRGNLAQRNQWRRVAELIRRTSLKPSDPDYLPPKQASKQFADSYKTALQEAGPPPGCLGKGG